MKKIVCQREIGSDARIWDNEKADKIINCKNAITKFNQKNRERGRESMREGLIKSLTYNQLLFHIPENQSQHH